jgi:photosystem II stability/assembly factor-like uncharacterized protein
MVDISNTALTAIETNGRIYVGIGNNGVFYSYDGIHWNMGTTEINSSAMNTAKVVWNGRIWVICGDGATNTMMYSYDGKQWYGVTNSRNMFDVSGGAMDIAWNGQLFVATGVCSNGYAVSTSIDGINWSTTPL